VREAVQLRRVGRPEGWADSIAAGGGGGDTAAARPYLPVGALVCPARQVQPIRKALEKLDWIKQTAQRIHTYCAPAPFGEMPEAERRKQMAIHVSPVAAAALDAAATKAAQMQETEQEDTWAAELPEELSECAAQLQSGQVRWCSGLRIGDPVQNGGLGPQWHLLPAEIKQETEALHQRDASAAAGGAFRFTELFAGIGGFRLALETIGGECVFSSEIGIEERLTYFMNFGSYPAGDITETPTNAVPPRISTGAGQRYELLTAGFPCQSFCKAGLKTGLDDARGELFFEVLRFAAAHRPAVLLLENVPHLVKIDDGAALARIIAEIASLGYRTHHKVLSSRNVVAQERKRFYIVAFFDEAQHAVGGTFCRLQLLSIDVDGLCLTPFGFCIYRAGVSVAGASALQV
jgi:hypothetical protein